MDWLTNITFDAPAFVLWLGKGMVIIALGWLVATLLATRVASVRFHVWLVALLGIVTLPLLSLVLPRVGLPFDTGWIEPVPSSSTWFGVHWTTWCLTIWLSGVFVLLVRLAGALAAVRRMTRGGEAYDPPEMRNIIARLSLRAGRPLRPRVILTDRSPMPATWGLWHPVILLPRAARDWSPERRTVVLTHEIMHISRRDWLTHIVAQVVCAVQWINPLVWYGLHRFCIERERACDEAVVASGVPASDYASHLLDTARSMSARWLGGPCVAMARRSQLEGRLLTILEPGHRAPRLLFGLPIVASLALAIVALGCVHPHTAADNGINSRPVMTLEIRQNATVTEIALALRPMAEELQSYEERLIEIEALKAPLYDRHDIISDKIDPLAQRQRELSRELAAVTPERRADRAGITDELATISERLLPLEDELEGVDGELQPLIDEWNEIVGIMRELDEIWWAKTEQLDAIYADELVVILTEFTGGMYDEQAVLTTAMALIEQSMIVDEGSMLQLTVPLPIATSIIADHLGDHPDAAYRVSVLAFDLDDATRR